MIKAKPPERPKTIPGVHVGHASDFKGMTGCTVVLVEAGAVCGVDIRGSASGTREIETCRPGHLVDRVHGILLAGGSAFGLDAATGVIQFLEERGAGFAAGKSRVPIVPAAVIFDLDLGSAKARPNAGMAAWACQNASRVVVEGSVGAGTGATVGKILGIRNATKGGVGFESMVLPKGNVVQALAVVNAFGDVVDPTNTRVIAGARPTPESATFAPTEQLMFHGKMRKVFGPSNTTLVVVLTNASLNKVQAVKLAEMAGDGLARAIRPAHTMFDGDTVFALSLGEKRADVSHLGAAAAAVTAGAIIRAVVTARGLGGVPGSKELPRPPFDSPQ
ncbi:MAG TPA: P1 family peptidase [Terriglobia bacterium]|nr:P1 family peptidase [Terriglobia bacterium]